MNLFKKLDSKKLFLPSKKLKYHSFQDKLGVISKPPSWQEMEMDRHYSVSSKCPKALKNCCGSHRCRKRDGRVESRAFPSY